jgi:hypothetical protein
VRSAYAFVGEGTALNADDPEGQRMKRGTGFGKKAQSQRAREERAAAAERRLQSLQAPNPEPDLHGSSDSDEEISDWVPETDQERRRNLQDTVGNDESLDGLKLRPGSSWLEFADEFNLPASRGTVTRPSTSKSDPVTIDIDSSETDDEDELPLFSCGMLKQSSGTPTSLGKNASASLSMNKGKRKVADQGCYTC